VIGKEMNFPEVSLFVEIKPSTKLLFSTYLLLLTRHFSSQIIRSWRFPKNATTVKSITAYGWYPVIYVIKKHDEAYVE